MDDNSKIRGIFTVCKFIVNTDPEKSRNRIITKTLGKFGVVNMDYRGPSPKHDEIWLVKIDKEIKCGAPAGCLVLTPIMPVPVEQVLPLIPSPAFSTEYIENGVCYVVPKNQDKYYMIPISCRKARPGARFTICVHKAPGSLQVTSTNPYAGTKPEPINGWTESAVAEYEKHLHGSN